MSQRAVVYFRARAVNVLYTNSLQEAETWLRAHMPALLEQSSSAPKIIGFDIEWRPTFRAGQYNKTALMQLAVSPTEVLLLQLRSTGTLRAQSPPHHRPKSQDRARSFTQQWDGQQLSAQCPLLARLLNDDEDRFWKVGVGIREDAQKLSRDLDAFPMRSFFPVEEASALLYRHELHRHFGVESVASMERVTKFVRSRTYRSLLLMEPGAVLVQQHMRLEHSVFEQLPIVDFSELPHPSKASGSTPFDHASIQKFLQTAALWSNAQIKKLVEEEDKARKRAREEVVEQQRRVAEAILQGTALPPPPLHLPPPAEAPRAEEEQRLSSRPKLLLPLMRPQKSSLAHLAATYLNVNLNKPKNVIMSNWETYPLSLPQIEYAALDALVGMEIMLEILSRLRQGLDREQHAHLDKQLRGYLIHTQQKPTSKQGT